MLTDLASIPAQAADNILDKGWVSGSWTGGDGSVCLHQAVRMCSPQTGDGYIVSAWLTANGYGTDWNDAPNRERDDVLFLLKGLDLRDEDFEATFGPNWREWVSLVRLMAGLTWDKAQQLAAARTAARVAAKDTAWAAARDAAWVAAWASARDAAWARDAAGAAAWDAARDTVWAAARDAAWDAAKDAAWAAVGKPNLAQNHYDLLMRPIVEVFGPDWANT